MDQISGRVKQKQADLHILQPSAMLSNIDSLPLFQQRNLGLAHAAVDCILNQNGEPALTDEMTQQAAKTYIPGRMEEVRLQGKTLIIDGAHNAQKLHALSTSVRRRYPDQPIAAVVSFVGGRSYRLEDAAEELIPLLDHIIITSFNSPQDGPHASVEAHDLAELFVRHRAKSVEIVPDPRAAFQKLLERPELILMVAGSFYLLNHIRPLVRESLRKQV